MAYHLICSTTHKQLNTSTAHLRSMRLNQLKTSTHPQMSFKDFAASQFFQWDLGDFLADWKGRMGSREEVTANLGFSSKLTRVRPNWSQQDHTVYMLNLVLLLRVQSPSLNTQQFFHKKSQTLLQSLCDSQTWPQFHLEKNSIPWRRSLISTHLM